MPAAERDHKLVSSFRRYVSGVAAISDVVERLSHEALLALLQV